MMILYILMFVHAAWSASISLRDCDYCHRNAARCEVGHVVENSCVRCECSVERLYQCEAVSPACDADNVILDKSTVSCEPHMIYVHESLTCMCSKSGSWPHDKCAATFKALHDPEYVDKLKGSLPSKIKKTDFEDKIKKMVATNYNMTSASDIKKILAANYDPANSGIQDDVATGVGAGGSADATNDIAAERESCEPDSYVVKDCNVCKCNAQGVMERCTHNDCSQAERTDIRRAFGNVLGSCVPNNWYALAPCQFCFCQQTNKLVCSTRPNKPYRHVVSLGDYNLTDCGQDFIKELYDLNPITNNNMLREGAIHGVPARVYMGEPDKVYRGEPAKVYMGEPAKAYMGEHAKVYRGEPVKVYMGEPAKAYMPASGPVREPYSGHMGEPAEIYMPPHGRDGESLSVPDSEHMGEPAEVYMPPAGRDSESFSMPASEHMGEPAEVYMPPPGRDGESLSAPASTHMGEPAEVYMPSPGRDGGPARVPVGVHMGEPAEVYMPAHRPVELRSPHDSNLQASLHLKKPNEPYKAEYETEYEDEPASEVLREQNTLSPFENEEESGAVEEENSSPSSYVRQPDGSYKPVFDNQAMRIPSNPQQPSVLDAMMAAQGMPKEMIQILSSMPEVSQMHSSLLADAKAGNVHKYDVVVKPAKPGVTPSSDSHVLRVNLPSVLERVIQMALRKSMVRIDATQSCMPGTTTQEGCNFCYCLTNGKLLCTDKKTC